MLPLNSIIKDAFDKFDQDFQAANLPQGKYIKAPLSTPKWYKVGPPCYEDKIQELNTDFAKICISPKPPGAPMGKVPLPILKDLEHEARQNISTLNFATTFAKTSSSCNSTLEKCQHSLKSTFKKVKSQIKKGADPEKAAKRGFEEACEYLDPWNKTILIQHRALTCLSKSLAHILQRELYSMGNTGLLRREAETTLLQSQLFCLPCSSHNWLRKVKTSFLKKAPQKILGVLDPTRTSPFVAPTRKEAPTGNTPMGVTPLRAVTSRFPPAGENLTSEAPGVVFDPTIGEEGLETPPPNDSSKASLSPPVLGRHPSFSRDWQTNYYSSNVSSQMFQFTSLPFGLATAPQVFTMIVKEVKLMALSRGLRLHQYLDDWLIRSHSQEEAQVNTQPVVDLT